MGLQRTNIHQSDSEPTRAELAGEKGSDSESFPAGTNTQSGVRQLVQNVSTSIEETDTRGAGREMITCCIGIMAYNEEANMPHLLEALLAQKTKTVEIDQIIVVASGCSDKTESIVQDFATRDSRILLLTQASREGKASAVNLLMANTKHEVVVLQSADTIPTPDTIEALVSSFADPEVGMAGGRPVPTNPRDTFMGYGVHMLWELHHKIALAHPKMGELIAFRNIFRQIPYVTAVDEASIEPLIIGQGLKLIYVPEAVVLNRGPATVQDFIKQRRRIFAGHLYVKETVGYKVSTMNSFRIVMLLLRNLKFEWQTFLWVPPLILLETYVRFLAVCDYAIWKRKPYTWAVVESTKNLIENT